MRLSKREIVDQKASAGRVSQSGIQFLRGLRSSDVLPAGGEPAARAVPGERGGGAVRRGGPGRRGRVQLRARGGVLQRRERRERAQRPGRPRAAG